MWPYVAQLLARRHQLKAMFWNSAVGSTSLQASWNGQKVASASAAGVGDITISGVNVTTTTGGLDMFADGDVIQPRNLGANFGARTVTGTPSSTALTVTSAFAADGVFSTGALHGPYVGFQDGGFDPNSYYSDAKTNGFDVGRFDARYVLLQFGNNDQNNRQSQDDVEANLQAFVDYWRDAGADGILLGGTLQGTTASGTVFNNDMRFMQDAWLPACEAIVAANSGVYLGAHIGQEVDWVGTGWYKSDGIHWNHDLHYVASEAWYRAIATMLGLALSTAGRAYTAIGSGELTYPATRTA